MKQNCRVCKSSNSKFLFEINNNRFMRCRNCTHVFLDIIHDEYSIRKMYESYGTERGLSYLQGIDSKTLDNINTYLKSCQKYCLTKTPTLRLMDIGCGTGELLDRANKLGFTVEGIEICETLAKNSSKKIACTVHNNLLSHLTLSKESFDVIIMYDLLEHLQDPISDVKIAYDLLKKGGVLFILSPNDDALIRKFSKLVYFLSIHHLDKLMQLLYYQDHLSYFTRKSLITFLKGIGFEIISIEVRNQELGRLQLSPILKLGVRLVFHISRYFSNSGGKFIVYARKT